MMNFKWMNILVVILYADQNFVTEGRCTNGEVSPDPSDKTCKRYFLCSNGRLVEQQCLNNFVFSKTTRTCVPTSSAYNDCYRNPYAAPKTTKRVIAVYTTRRPKTTTYKTYPRCKEGETRPHPHDCKSYYVCSYHAWIPRVCPKQNVYSKTVGKCVMSYSPYDYCSKTMYKRTTATTTRETYRMTTTTPVYTTTKYRTTTYKHYQRCKEGETRPHYKDCKSYFICSYNVWNPKTCPKHNVYSKTVGKCVMSHSPYDYCSKSTYKRTTTTPVYTTSRYRTTTSRYKTTTSRYRTTTSRYRTTTPRYRTTTPRYRITTPRYRITTPRYRITTPRYRITTPRYRITTPRYRTTTRKYYPKCKEGETRPHPQDCKSYYVCSYYAWVPKVCPHKNVYSKTVGKCVMSYSPFDHCSKTSYKRMTSTTTEYPDYIERTSTTESCTSGETYPVRNNCYRYYYCSNGIMQQRTCVFDFVYSRRIKRCVPRHSKHADCKT